MDAPSFNGAPGESRMDHEWDDAECADRCGECGAPLEPSPYNPRVFHACGDCFGGTDSDPRVNP
jgi:hypothetical protein